MEVAKACITKHPTGLKASNQLPDSDISESKGIAVKATYGIGEEKTIDGDV
jgi:hypothetical protein